MKTQHYLISHKCGFSLINYEYNEYYSSVNMLQIIDLRRSQIGDILFDNKYSCQYVLDRIIFHHDFHHHSFDYHWDFYGH